MGPDEETFYEETFHEESVIEAMVGCVAARIGFHALADSRQAETFPVLTYQGARAKSTQRLSLNIDGLPSENPEMSKWSGWPDAVATT